jgi:hypothetical protein
MHLVTKAMKLNTLRAIVLTLTRSEYSVERTNADRLLPLMLAATGKVLKKGIVCCEDPQIIRDFYTQN